MSDTDINARANARDWLALCAVPAFGAAKAVPLLERFGDAAGIAAAADDALIAAGMGNAHLAAFRSPDAEQRAQTDQALEWLEADNHTLISICDAAYPGLLKATGDPPLLLFAQGQTDILKSHQLAIVGSRNPSRNGMETAYAFARHLAGTGLAITSGLAAGIDAASHQGCLDAGGRTIAVTGNGLDRVYPPRHRDMARRIAGQGLLVSEFFPGTRPLPQHFPRRNRVIAGLSLGTLVVEAAQKSGSLITAYRALDYGREVFAIPGSIHNPLARGCHRLIRQGAKLVESAQDILEELGPLAGVAAAFADNDAPPTAGKTEPNNESHEKIMRAMAYDPVSVDTIVERTGMSTAEVSSVLLILELENKITSAAGRYTRVHSQPCV